MKVIPIFPLEFLLSISNVNLNTFTAQVILIIFNTMGNKTWVLKVKLHFKTVHTSSCHMVFILKF